MTENFVETIVRLRFWLVSFVFVLFVFLGIHGSSLGCWDVTVPTKTNDYSYPGFGVSRGVRADEWYVSLPWCLAQYEVTPMFPVFNPKIDTDGMQMGVATPNCPVLSYTLLGQLHNWGFILLGPKSGLAWRWWIRYLGIALLCFELLYRCVGMSRSTAFLGALGVVLAPPTQWFDTTVPFHLFYLFCVPVFLFMFLKAKRVSLQLFWCSLMLIGILSFIFTWYPPFQIPCLMLLIAFCFVAYKQCAPLSLGRWRAGMLIGCALLAVVVVSLFVFDNWAALERVSNSAYPGARRFTGGERSVAEEISNAGHLFRPSLSLYFPFRNTTFRNNCEMSTFIFPFPALLVVLVPVLLRGKQGGVKRLFTYLVVIGSGLLCWTIFRFPEWVGRLTGLFICTPHRVYIPASFALQLASVCGFYLVKRDKIRIRPLVAGCVTAAAVLSFIVYIFTVDMAKSFYFDSGITPLNVGMLLLVLSIWGAMNYGLMRGSSLAFGTSVVAYALIAGLCVHPFRMGLSPIYDKQLAVACRALHEERPDSKWIEVGQSTLSQYLVAIGVPVLTGVHCTSDVDFWSHYDPDGDFEQIYNRYAHVRIVLDSDEPRFKLRETGQGLFTCALLPEELLSIPSLGFVISRHRLDIPRLHLRQYIKGDHIFIYELVSPHLDYSPRTGQHDL